MMQTNQILKLTLDDERWIPFVESFPQSNIFHHPIWMNMLAGCYGYRPFILAVVNEKKEILAGLPVMEVSSPIGPRRWVSLPFTDYCTPLSRSPEDCNYLLDGLLKIYLEKQISKIELRWEVQLNQAAYSSAHYLLHTLNLSKDFDHVAAGFDRIHRQNVRQARKNGIEVRWGKDVEDTKEFYHLQLETRQRHGVPSQPWRYFRFVSKYLMDQGFCSVLLAYMAGKCIAGMVLIHWNGNLVCKYAASREESMKFRPNNLLFWTAIQWACENDYRLFDMGRTDLDNPGLIRFKRGWGADENKLDYFTISRKQQTPLPSFLMPLMKPVIQKSPRFVCQIMGELFYKYAG